MGASMNVEQLAHYRIEGELGTGGMGVVHRAHDLRLRRDVALKVLPPEMSADPEARARLLREARMASALNHPGVCTIYEIGEADGLDYIAMELVEGRTLRAHIPSEGMPLEEIVLYGTQIAEALAHAHERHVIHRDLKSANVMVTNEGRAKILDFGLAKRRWEEGREQATQSNLSLTSTGTLLGTPHCLPPEALLGRESDARSDLWALGILLHEMASGEIPFKGTTVAAVYSAILHDAPAPLPSRLPAGLRDLIRHLLEKDPADRPANATAVRLALEALRPATHVRVPRRSRLTLVVVVAAAAIIAGAPWVAWRHARTRTEPPETPLTSFPPENPVLSAALTRDGRHLAFADTSGYFLLDVGTRRISVVSGSEEIPRVSNGWGDHAQLTWLTDGESLIISTTISGSDSLWLVSMLDRHARRLRDGAREPAVAPDGGSIAFLGRDSLGSGIWLMGIDGSLPRRVTPPTPQDHSYEYVTWSPGGGRLAYVTSHGSADSGTFRNVIESCDLQGGGVREVFTNQWLGAGWGDARRGLCWLPDGRLSFFLPDSALSQDVGDLWAIPVNQRTGAPRGRPSRILRSVGSYLSDLTCSADGKRLACVRWRTQFDVYLAAVEAGNTRFGPDRRLTLDQHNDLLMGWTPDSKEVLILSARSDPPSLYRQGVHDRSAVPLLDGPGGTQIAAITADGAWILYLPQGHRPAEQGEWLMRAPLAGGPARTLGWTDASTMLVGCGSSPGAPCVMTTQAADELIFFRIDPLTGARTEMTRIPWDRAYQRSMWSLSPDGWHAATDLQRGRLVLDLRSGEKSRPRLRGWEDASFTEWAADGGRWFVRTAKSGRSSLLHVSPAGQARVVGAFDITLGMGFSPDGRWIAFNHRTYEANVWLIEDI